MNNCNMIRLLQRSRRQASKRLFSGKACWLLVGLFLCIFIACHPAAAAPVLALIPGEGDRAPAETDLSEIEAALSQTKDVEVVERQQIRRILAEQYLTLSGLADPSTAARLGRLISADLFLFIEKT